MRFVVLTFLLGACAGSNNNAPAGDAVLKQLRTVTRQQRPSFESPGDATSLAPTPDSGSAISGTLTCDESTCLPR